MEGSRRWLEMEGILPRARVEQPLRSCILAILDGGHVEFVRKTPRKTADLGSIEIARELGERLDTHSEMILREIGEGDLPVVLRLSADKGVRCTDTLPQLSGNELRAVVAHRLDMLTPWSEHQVHFDARPLARLDNGQMEIEVTVVPRRIVEEALETIAAIGLSVHSVDLAGTDPYTDPRYDLRQRVPFERSSRSLPAALAVVVLLGLIAAGFLGYRYWQQDRVISERERLATALTERLADVPDLHSRIEALRGETDYIYRRKRSLPSTLAVIDELSAIIPGDVWLTRLSIDGEELAANGYSPDASSLLGIVEAADHLSGAEFRSPSTRRTMLVGDSEVEVDAFSIAARLDGSGDAEGEDEETAQ
ncbi:MAG: PilN domain-containing protein [Geminicoccaceae bacterium]|nr:PilN domain-containing protein [Geminicoccaceae bacterium]